MPKAIDGKQAWLFPSPPRPSSPSLPVSPQQLEGSQDHDEVERLHVKRQCHEPQECKQGD